MYNTPIPQPSELPLPSDPEEVFDAKFAEWDATMRVAYIAFNKAIRAIALDHIAHSVSSNEISYGTKTFLVETGKGFAPSMSIKAVPDDDLSQFLLGVVLDYNIDTGVLQMDVEDARGGGNYNAWTITLAVAGGATGSGGSANLRYLETTGTAADYLADLAIPISNYKDGDVFNVKFHTECVANATLKISGINPALDLKVQASDGLYVNVAAKDIVAGHQCLVRIANGATVGIIEPATSLEALSSVVANTTFTLANALDRTIVSNGALSHLLPLMGEFPVNGSFSVYNENLNCTITRQGLDTIKFNGASVTSVTLKKGMHYIFINRGTEWICIANSIDLNTGGFSKIAIFTANGAFNMPEGKTDAEVIVVGGGGGGSNSGGGKGGYLHAFLTGLSGEIPVTVGLGGNGVGGGGLTAGSGGASSFGTFATAFGGGGAIGITPGANAAVGVSTGTIFRAAANIFADTFLGGTSTKGSGGRTPWSVNSQIMPGANGTGINIGGMDGVVIVKY